MENSHIQWCDNTFNGWEGCTKVSPGCQYCYAENRNQRFAGGANWGKGAPRRRTSAANWLKPLAWDRAAAAGNFRQCLVCGKREQRRWEIMGLSSCSTPGCLSLAETESIPVRPRVFCSSLADWLDDEVPIEWLADLLLLFNSTRNFDWLLLTKRPYLWRDRLRAAQDKLCNVGSIPRDCADEMVERWIAGQPPKNVWIGTTVEDQPRADERREDFKSIPAVVHFVSYEPALSLVDWTGWEFIAWLISGGESGRNARPSHPDWHRLARNFCARNGKAYLFKQWGEWLPQDQQDAAGLEWVIGHNDARNHDWEPGGFASIHIGKKNAGRLLDGEEHNGFPQLAK